MVLDTLIQSTINGILMGAIYGLIVLGLSIIFGVMNVVNFAHGDFVMFSMYLAFMVGSTLKWDAVFTSVITVPIIFVFGLLVYYLMINRTLRESYVVQLAVTVGLFTLMRAAALLIWQGWPRGLSYSIVQGSITIGKYQLLTSRLLAAVISVIFFALVALFLNKTWAGKAMRAASDDLDVASLMGVNFKWTYALTFAIGSALTAVAGSLLMSFQTVDPYGGIRFGLLSWCILALAGLGTIPGVLISGIIIGVAESVEMAFYDPRASYIAVYAIFILVLWLKPRGLFGRK